MPLHPEAVSEFSFIPPCNPIRAKEVPAYDGWLHEVKFDRCRLQLALQPFAAAIQPIRIIGLTTNPYSCKNGGALPDSRTVAQCH